MPAGPRSVKRRQRAVGDRVLVGAPQALSLALSSDERSLEVTRERRRVTRCTSSEAEGLDGLGLPLERERLDGLDADGVADEQPRLGADEHLAGCRGLLEARGDVDGVAGDERLALAADDDFAGVDADPRLEPVLRRSPPASPQAARTARSASSSCETGIPKTAITASPTNFSTLPPCRSRIARRSSK